MIKLHFFTKKSQISQTKKSTRNIHAFYDKQHPKTIYKIIIILNLVFLATFKKKTIMTIIII